MKNIFFILFISLLLFSCDKDRELEEFPATAEKVFTFECIPNEKVKADGQSLIEFKAELIDKDAPISFDNNIIEFRSLAGKFLDTNNTTDTATFNRLGMASSFLQVGVDTGYFACIAIVGKDQQFSISDTIRLLKIEEEPPVSPTIVINPQPKDLLNPLTADGYSIINVDLEVTESSSNSISLSSTQGSFINLDSSNSLFLDVDGIGQALLRVNTKPGEYLITGSLDNSISATAPIMVDRSYPDYMLLTPSSSKIKTSDGEITITADLRKDDPLKLISDDAKVEFSSYYEGTNQAVGFLSSAVSFTGTDGKAIIKFKTETEVDSTQMIIIEARTLQDLVNYLPSSTISIKATDL